MNSTREQRRQLARDNLTFPIALRRLPDDEWRAKARDNQIEVWRSRSYLVQVYQESAGVVRLTVCSIEHDGANWKQDIPWEDLQRLKRECGRGDMFAVEIYPADIDVVNVSNMRHLWVMPEPLPFGWKRK